MIRYKRSVSHYAFLDGMRGFAALYVVLFHFLSWLAPDISPLESLVAFPFKFGHTAVSVFIVLSGFSLMLPIVNNPVHDIRGGICSFFQRRARRILPPYYAALALSITATFIQDKIYKTPPVPLQNSVLDIFMHMLLLHNFSLKWVFSINPVFWSIATEAQLYVMLPFFIVPLWKRAGMPVVLFFLCIFALLLALPHEWSGACLWYIALFGFGATAASLAPRITAMDVEQWKRFRQKLTVVIIACVTFYVFASVSGEWNFEGVKAAVKDMSIGGAVAVLIAFGVRASTINSQCGPVMRLLESKAGNILSGFSYSLYLTHAIFLNIIIRLGTHHEWSSQHTWYWRVLVGVPVSIVFSWCFHLVFERPFLTRNREKIEKEPILRRLAQDN